MSDIKRKLKTKENRSIASNLLICLINAVISFSVFVVLTSVITLLSLNKTLSDGKILILLFASLIVTGITAGLLSSRLNIKAIISSFITCLILSVLLFLLFVFTGSFNFSYRTLISFLILFASCISSGIIFKNIRR